jgi:hypothetical protein
MNHPWKYYHNMNTIWKKDIINAYVSGKTLRELAEQYNTGKDTLRIRLIKWGVKLRKSGDYTQPGKKRVITDDFLEENKYQIINLYNHGLSTGRLSARFKINHRNLKQALQKWNVFEPDVQKRRQRNLIIPRARK